MKKEFNKFLNNDLNKPQLQAVLSEGKALLVIAGAGSGKTRVITSRIANLILNKNVEPSSIVALTFTNKAAGEMKSRLIHFLGAQSALPFVGTFHSYCLMLLRSNPHLAPYENFSILDNDDQLSILKKILKNAGMDKKISPSSCLSQISGIKNKGALSKEESIFSQPLLKEIFLAYESDKNAARCLDFDDLLLEVMNLLEKKDEFKKKLQNKMRHMLIDEYQDTNAVQHELLKRIALSSKKLALDSICAVGDEDQSIYSWRGAVPENIEKFEKDFAPVTKIKIEQNFRSVQPILNAANALIAHNKKRNEKNLWSSREAKGRIITLVCKSQYQEADAATTFIKLLPKQQLASSAILYRTHFQSRVIEEALIVNGIPYKIIGGIQFYQRKEIKDLLAYLKLIANPHDRLSLFRVINLPTRGLGDRFQKNLLELWDQNSGYGFQELLEEVIGPSTHASPELDEGSALAQDERRGKLAAPKQAEEIKKFLDIFKGASKEQKTSKLVHSTLQKSDYLNYLRNSYDAKEADSKIENIREFVASVDYFERKPDETPRTLETFLHEVSLMQERQDKTNPQESQILLMTMHAAKGLEFENVLIVGIEENLFPSPRSLNSLEALEEERRLFYVGITRAKERLILSHAYQRSSFGQVSEQVRSRFLDEVPISLTKEVNVMALHPVELRQFFSGWLGKKPQEDVVFFGNGREQSFKTAEKRPKKSQSSQGHWQKNQAVMHQKFGAGIVVGVEPFGQVDTGGARSAQGERSERKFSITVIFRSGEKKILSDYLKPL